MTSFTYQYLRRLHSIQSATHLIFPFLPTFEPKLLHQQYWNLFPTLALDFAMTLPTAERMRGPDEPLDCVLTNCLRIHVGTHENDELKSHAPRNLFCLECQWSGSNASTSKSTKRSCAAAYLADMDNSVNSVQFSTPIAVGTTW